MDAVAMPNKTNYSGNQGKILEMLGNGLTPEIVATALGISPSYISQLMSEESFAEQVTQLRFTNLQAATARDRNYDSIEDELIKKMQDLLPMMFRPMEVLRAITVINQAKRRGVSSTENTVINQTIVQLSLPAAIMNNFVSNSNNQVVSAGSQELVTIQSTQLNGVLKDFKSRNNATPETFRELPNPQT